MAAPLSLAFAIVVCALLAGCQSIVGFHGNCIEHGDRRPWAQLQSPPPNAEAYRRATDANPGLRGGWAYRRELWFATPAGEVTLCRLGEYTAARLARSGATWEFTRDGDLAEEGSVWFTLD